MKKIARPTRYIYIDEEGINSLLSQIVDRLEETRSIEKSNGRKSRISGGINLGNALGSLFGLLNLKGEVGSESNNEQAKTVSSKFTCEQKLRELLNHLNGLGEPTIFSTITAAAKFVESQKDAVFISASTEFDMPQFICGTGPSEINKTGTVNFERNTGLGDTYNHGDSYFKNKIIPVVMAASLRKFPSCRDHMSQTGHEAMYFRGHNGKKIPLHVFGSFFKLPKFYQIKPYAIWF